MGAQNHGFIAANAANQLTDFDQLVGVEPRGWLVEDENFGVVNQGGRKAYALAKSFGELGNALVPLGA